MKSALLHKKAFTGYPNEIELLEKGGDRLFEVDSLRQLGQRMLVAVAEDGSKDYPVFNEDSGKVTWQSADRFGKKFKEAVKKYMRGEVEEAETTKEVEEATNDPKLRTGSIKTALTKKEKPDTYLEGVYDSPAKGTVHDFKPLIDEIRRDVYNYKALDPAEKLIALSKRVGTEDMVIAACQYFRALDKFLDAGGLNGLRNRQRVSAVDDAWKRLQAVFVRFVR